MMCTTCTSWTSVCTFLMLKKCLDCFNCYLLFYTVLCLAGQRSVKERSILDLSCILATGLTLYRGADVLL